MQLIYHILVFILSICVFVLWVWLRKANKDALSFLNTRSVVIIERYLERINQTMENLNSKFWEYDNYLTNLQKAIEEERREIIKLLEKVTNLLPKEKTEENSYAVPKENKLLVTELNHKIEELEDKLEQYVQNTWVKKNF